MIKEKYHQINYDKFGKLNSLLISTIYDKFGNQINVYSLTPQQIGLQLLVVKRLEDFRNE